jgi:hypothetical protein
VRAFLFQTEPSDARTLDVALAVLTATGRRRRAKLYERRISSSIVSGATGLVR